MKLLVSHLRQIIKEEVSKVIDDRPRKYEVRGVLAGCYRGKQDERAILTHYYDVTDGEWSSETTLCNRIKDATGRLCDESLPGPATCPSCVAKMERLMKTKNITIDSSR